MPMGRKISDNWLWDSYNSLKFRCKKGVTAASPHEIKIAVFNMLSTSQISSKSDEFTDEVHDLNILSYSDVERTTTRLSACDLFIEGDNDG